MPVIARLMKYARLLMMGGLMEFRVLAKLENMKYRNG